MNFDIWFYTFAVIYVSLFSKDPVLFYIFLTLALFSLTLKRFGEYLAKRIAKEQLWKQ